VCRLEVLLPRAKEVLKLLASEYLKCPVDRLSTKNGIVFDTKRADAKVTTAPLQREI
jgi:hypothetical protein